ncbi:MAG TPA: hypothetical protein VIJ66_04495 [Solirubrobacteraceae bacterium]
MTEDPYVYPGTDVLINSLDIRDPWQLAVAEADIATVALATLTDEPLPGDYDTAHSNARASREAHQGDNQQLRKLLDGLIDD